MASVWAESVAAELETALNTLSRAVGECEGDAWDLRMWEVPRADPTEPQDAFAQRFSTPWSVSWHALEVLDYYLTGNLTAWAGPPAPFTDHPHWRDLATLPRPWHRSEILGYIEHCRQRVRDTFDGLTDERAATPVPEPFHLSGSPYARLLTNLVAHTTEHAAQILQHRNAQITAHSL